jgi:hypothetical protein
MGVGDWIVVKHFHPIFSEGFSVIQFDLARHEDVWGGVCGFDQGFGIGSVVKKNPSRISQRLTVPAIIFTINQIQKLYEFRCADGKPIAAGPKQQAVCELLDDLSIHVGASAYLFTVFFLRIEMAVVAMDDSDI